MSDPARYTDDDYENSRRIAKWLSAPDPSTNHSRAHQQHHKGTGLWFIKSNAFEEWKRYPDSSLWLYGIPGCGKTVLTSTIIEHLRQDTTCQVLLYFYFDSSDTDKQSLNSLSRSLITQLCRELPEASELLYQLWVTLSGGPKQPSTDFLQSALRSLLGEVGNVSIVLDALDESTTRHELLAWLETLAGSKTTNCRLLVTSRGEEEIELALESWIRTEDRISIQRNEVNKDISAYIKDRVRNRGDFERWQYQLDMQEAIEVTLMEKAEGM
jgi:Cdc6-like AAA superfamily ATPase